jgi:predicted Fe-Mo cluster-binding NifX family protein
MKIAISAAEDNLDSSVFRSFGRCPWFLFVDTESLSHEAVINQNADAASGAGTACAQLVLEKEAEVVISGQVGPNAYEVLKQSGVRIFLAPKDICAKEAIEKHKRGELRQMEMKVF